MKRLAFSAALAIAIAQGTSAFAQPDDRLNMLCMMGMPCVYDPHNQVVGLAGAGQQGDMFSTLQRSLDGTVYQVLYEMTEGFVMPAYLTDVFFAGANCPASGPAYVLANPAGDPPIQVPQFLAQYDPDLHVLWGATSIIVERNVAYASRLFGGSCQNTGGTIPAVLPAKIVDPSPPAGPFSER